MKTLLGIILSSFVFVFAGCNEENNGGNHEISGKLVQYSGCGGFKSARSAPASRDTLSCVEYNFDKTTGKLTLLHLKTGFNCCPESLMCKISVHKDTIIFEESELKVGCKCNCLFDMEIEVNGVEAKDYWIRFIEPYALDQPKLVFKVSLSKTTTGKFCVARTRYPWG